MMMLASLISMVTVFHWLSEKKDFGSLICADSRILSKNYGEEFMNCIPDYSYIQEPVLEISDHIKSWLDKHE